MLQLKIRNPDKPIRTSQDMLKTFTQEGGYICTAKLDGWRCMVDWDGNEPSFHSRREVEKGGPTILGVSPSVQEEMKKFLIDNKIPSNTRLDTEWMSQRTNGPEQIHLIGLQYWDGHWIGNKIEEIRWAIISSFKYDDNIQIVNHTITNYEEFFNQLKETDLKKPKEEWWAEGVVLKHKNSKLIGDLKTCRKNPQWFKVKWRDAASGDDLRTF